MSGQKPWHWTWRTGPIMLRRQKQDNSSPVEVRGREKDLRGN